MKHFEPDPPAALKPKLDSPPTLDSLDIRKSIQAFPDQCSQIIQDSAVLQIPPHCYSVQNIVVSGMGGSAFGGRLLASLERQTLKVPIVVSTEYHLPNFVNEKTLVIISSYSGNTEETLCSMAESRARGAQIFVICSGGKLAEISAKFDLPALVFQPTHNPSHQPRMGLGYNILGTLSLLTRCHLIHISETLGLLPQFLRQRQSDFPKLAQLASELQGKIPVIISSEHLKGAAHVLRNQLHENSKTFAVTFDLPEADHHLLEGLSYPKNVSGQLAFLFIGSSRYHPEVRRRHQMTRQIIEKQGFPVHELFLTGNSPLFESFDLIQSGAYLAYALSQVNGVDPGPIPWVDWFKEHINDQE